LLMMLLLLVVATLLRRRRMGVVLLVLMRVWHFWHKSENESKRKREKNEAGGEIGLLWVHITSSLFEEELLPINSLCDRFFAQSILNLIKCFWVSASLQYRTHTHTY
jgi:hypothetical protein